MHRPQFAAWLTSIAERLPLRAIPPQEQIRRAREMMQQPEVPWCELSLASAQALVWAQAQSAAGNPQHASDVTLAAELLAALTWDRQIVRPLATDLMQLQRRADIASSVMPDLASIAKQTVYMLVEMPTMGEHASFVQGVWLIRDVDHDSGGPSLLLLLDLIVGATPDRTVLLQFPVRPSFEHSVEEAVERQFAGWPADSGSSAAAGRDHVRALLLGAKPLVAALHHTFVVGAPRIAAAAEVAGRDELGFSLVDLGPGSKAAAGVYH